MFLVLNEICEDFVVSVDDLFVLSHHVLVTRSFVLMEKLDKSNFRVFLKVLLIATRFPEYLLPGDVNSSLHTSTPVD